MWGTLNGIWRTRECTFMPYPTIGLIQKSNRQFLLKNRSKSIVHLKARIVTALSTGLYTITNYLISFATSHTVAQVVLQTRGGPNPQKCIASAL